MSKITVTRTIAAAPATVWSLIGDPGAMARWIPAVESSSLHGNRVTCVRKDGAKIVEEVTSRSAHSITYALVEAPVPVVGYPAALRVEPAGGATLVTWEATFEVKPGVPAAEIEGMVRGLFESGLASAEAMLVGE